MHAETLFALQAKPKRKSFACSDREVRARQILDALWPRVARAINGSMTQTMWRQRQKRTALDLASEGVTIERIVAAYDRACDRFRRRVYSLRIVQDQLLFEASVATVDPCRAAVPQGRAVDDGAVLR